jgi:hypothetical protein
VFKKKDGTEVDEAARSPKPELDEAAYEDSWYRSLKAMAKTHVVEGAGGAEGADEEDDDDSGSEA